MINKIVIIIDDQHTTYLNCIWRDVLTWGFNKQQTFNFEMPSSNWVYFGKQNNLHLSWVIIFRKQQILLFPKNTVVVWTTAQPC